MATKKPKPPKKTREDLIFEEMCKYADVVLIMSEVPEKKDGN